MAFPPFIQRAVGVVSIEMNGYTVFGRITKTGVKLKIDRIREEFPEDTANEVCPFRAQHFRPGLVEVGDTPLPVNRNKTVCNAL